MMSKNKPIELIDKKERNINNEGFQFKKRTLKEGFSLLKESTNKIKDDKRFFTMNILGIATLTILLQFMVLMTEGNETLHFGSELVFYFFTLLFIPSFIINSFKYKDVGLSFGQKISQSLDKIHSFKIIGILSIAMLITMLSFSIALYPIMDVSNGQSLTSVVDAYAGLTEHSNNPTKLEGYFSENPEALDTIQKFGEISKGFFIACFSIAAFIFITSMVVLFYMFFATIYFDHITLKESFLISCKINFKNASFLFSSTLGIIFVLMFSAFFEAVPFLNYIANAFFSIYVYYIFIELTNKIVINKK